MARAVVVGKEAIAASGEAALSCHEVTKRLGAKTVLRSVTLQVRRGEFVAIMGRSGSGKSTLVHVMAGLDRPDAGIVSIRQVDLHGLDADARAEFRLRNVGIVFQHFNLLGDLTVAQNVDLPLRLAHVDASIRLPRTRELLVQFGIAELADRFPESLSGGELQRVAIARSLAHRPAVVLADEPTANLDEANALSVVRAFQTAAKAGTAIVVASHDDVVREGASRRLRLVDGSLQVEA